MLWGFVFLLGCLCFLSYIVPRGAIQPQQLPKYPKFSMVWFGLNTQNLRKQIGKLSGRLKQN